jgi:multidrug resistance efflux pump
VKKKMIFILVTILMILSLAGVALYYWYQSNHYVITEDARVTGTLYKVNPQVAGKFLELNFEEGDIVQKGQVLARQDDATLSEDLNLDLTLVRAPIGGMILKKLAHVGEVGAAGQSIAMMADLNDLYVEANIEETDMYKLKVGQAVDFTIDSIPGHKFTGEVTTLGEATAAIFSLLPTQNTSGSFTKVVQRIPIKIKIDDFRGQHLLPGMNTIVRVHLQ